VQWGPQPYEALVSEVCDAFTTVPDVAERQPAQVVRAVLDYRNAKYALSLLEQGTAGFEQLSKNAGLQLLLLDLLRAQGVVDETFKQEHVLQYLKEDAEEEEE
jgi:hypothetical protein